MSLRWRVPVLVGRIVEPIGTLQRSASQRPALPLQYLSAGGHLLDGFHRVAKAYILGMNEIAAVQFPENPEPDRIRPLPEWLDQTLRLRR